jgi:transglutaminase-like putative cysteine protease
VAAERSFHFEYAARVTGIPPGAKAVRIWVPLPQDDSEQTISNQKVTAPVPVRWTRESLYGNTMAYVEVAAPLPPEVPIAVAFDVRREEAKATKDFARPGLRARSLERDRLVPLDGEVVARAEKATAGKAQVSDKARGIYDRVLADVNYDKSGQGWGRGDVKYVCDVGKGNCTDFHSLFIGMARAEGIPALFEIGFPIPQAKTEGEVAGYHCWAWFEDGDGTWRPVDASEADKDPTKTNYYFGTLCCNRVGLTRGRDIVLDPPQSGEPVNFLIYPYVEVDGKADVAKVERKFTFKDLPTPGL